MNPRHPDIVMLRPNIATADLRRPDIVMAHIGMADLCHPDIFFGAYRYGGSVPPWYSYGANIYAENLATMI